MQKRTDKVKKILAEIGIRDGEISEARDGWKQVEADLCRGNEPRWLLKKTEEEEEKDVITVTINIRDKFFVQTF